MDHISYIESACNNARFLTKSSRGENSMKIKFQGTAQDIAQIEEGTCLMLQDSILHSCLSGKDSMTAELKVTFTDAPDLTVKRTGTQAEITCQKPSHYYRGLTWLLHNLDQETYEKGKLRISHETV